MQGRSTAELSKAGLEILIQESIENGIETTIYVAQGCAEAQDGYCSLTTWLNTQSLNQDKDLHRCPAAHKHSHHYQHQPCDTPEIPVLLSGAGKQTDTTKSSNHEAVADRDDQHRDDEGKKEDADGKYRAPIVLRGRDLHQALDLCRREMRSEGPAKTMGN